MENHKNPNEKILAAYQESLGCAVKLFEEHKGELDTAFAACFGQTDMSRYLRLIPENIASRFSGHGITRGDRVTNLAMFLNIVANDSLKGDYGKLSGGGYTAWTNSDFFIISHYNKDLGIRDEAGNLHKNEVGFTADIGAYIVCNKYYPIIEELRRMFPNKNIIKAEEIADFVSVEAGSF